MSKILLSDHDIILKLAVWDLLDGLPIVLQVEPQNIFVLPTATYKLRKLINTGHDETVWLRIDGFLKSVPEVTWTIPVDEQQMFEDTLGIDPGEAILFSASALHQEFVLATGDKASLKALIRSPGCSSIVQRLVGHVVCLEQIIKKCIAEFGFEQVRNKIAIAPPCDKSIGAVFGSGLLATKENVDAGLDSYIRELKTLPTNLLTE